MHWIENCGDKLQDAHWTLTGFHDDDDDDDDNDDDDDDERVKRLDRNDVINRFGNKPSRRLLL